MSDSNNQLPQSVLLRYTGGHTVIYGGYIWELCPDHKNANPFGFVPQHRLIVERHLNRYLSPHEVVHHDNENKLDNSLDNLKLMTKSEHLKLHRERQRLKAHGKPEENEVAKFLQDGGIKYAAHKVGVCVETLRKYYPELTKPYVRRSPANIDDPELIKTIFI